MNQNQIQQLTSHLSQALDQNYDVVNMEAVLSVICALEGTTITKEQLEATRLAKYINQLRRRTKNEQLARRAKSLLKKWREMVGIQQTTNDSQQPPQALSHSSFKPNIGSNVSGDTVNIADTIVNTTHHYSSLPSSPSPSPTPSQRVISDLQSAVDSTEPHFTAGTQHTSTHHTNFSNLIKHMYNENSDESMTIFSKPMKHQQTAEPQKLATFINEHSTNSVPNLMINNDKLNEPPIVIDIVSDSDENDSGALSMQQKKDPSASPALPTLYSRPKKLKKDKDKRRKERDFRYKPSLFNLKEDISKQQSRNAYRFMDSNFIPIKEGKRPTTYPTDSEILSLSNSSMSSILSGDAASGNSQSKSRSATADLTFSGRFKSVNQLDALHNDNSVQANGQNSFCLINDRTSVDQPTRTIYDEYVNNDSSSSCSRLSPFEELEARQNHIHSDSKSFGEASMLLLPTPMSKQHDSSNKMEYCENIQSQNPKKRGRKKGSKGVDSVIAKESSLSQQILFGAGVKKVKTTKELFNEIQSRKISISFNRPDTFSGAQKTVKGPTLRNRESQSLLMRPTSSCSEASIHSPQTLEAFSTNISLSGIDKFSNKLEDAGNTDSDTITSEPSRDSIKSGKTRRNAFLDSNSNSNSLQTSSVKNPESLIPITNHKDVTTQLMHLVHSLNSPLSVDDTERLYQAQIVPCTCKIVEEMLKLSSGQNNISHLDNEVDGQMVKCKDEIIQYANQSDKLTRKTDNHPEEAALPQKPMKSIFDLDFDEDDDPLHSITKKMSPSSNDLKLITNNDTDNNRKASTTDGILTGTNNVEIQAVPAAASESNQSQETNEKLPDSLSTYTVHEDPNCIAKKRFIVQTNDVTNFHINALHNYYVPNINGNWNTIDLSSSLGFKSTISEFLKTYESYSVSDGSDVVPKYGSLTYERIKKDLSSLKLQKSFKTKIYKSYIPPFLGIAKCLPSCRLAAKGVKDEMKFSSSTLPSLKHADMIIHLNQQTKLHRQSLQAIKGSPSPLRVDIDVDTHVEINDNPKQMRYSDNNTHLLPNCIDNNTTPLSYNLLKLAYNNSSNLIKNIADGVNSVHTICESDNSSTCTNSNPKITENSINMKLGHQKIEIKKNEQTEQNVIERNRKKRRKSTRQAVNYNREHYDNTKPRIKRIKIAINGNVASQRQISYISGNISNEEEQDVKSVISETDYARFNSTQYYHLRGPMASEDEHKSYRSHSTTIDKIDADEGGHLEIENEYDNSSDDEYAIVQKPMIGEANNHIVLTIKKTPSKINSPVNSISVMSPIVDQPSVCDDLEVETAKNINFKTNNIKHSETDIFDVYPYSFLGPSSSRSHKNKSEIVKPTCHRCYRNSRSRLHRRFRKPLFQKETLDIELKHLFSKNKNTRTTQSTTKTHRKLFFINELCTEDNAGRKERIINYSSSSSNYGESDFEDGAVLLSSSKVVKNQFADNFQHKLNIETDESENVKEIAAENKNFEEDPYLSSSDESLNDKLFRNQYKSRKYDTQFEMQDELPLLNNRMLPSFNSIGDLSSNSNSNLTNDVKNATPLKSLQIENCDVNSKCYNNNNLNVIKVHSLGSLSPINNNHNGNKELQLSSVINNISKELHSNENDDRSFKTLRKYRTGRQDVLNDTLSKHDSNPSRIQQFREWHEVLQLKSYNNEPLIVLPYVVLE